MRTQRAAKSDVPDAFSITAVPGRDREKVAKRRRRSSVEWVTATRVARLSATGARPNLVSVEPVAAPHGSLRATDHTRRRRGKTARTRDSPDTARYASQMRSMEFSDHLPRPLS